MDNAGVRLLKGYQLLGSLVNTGVKEGREMPESREPREYYINRIDRLQTQLNDTIDEITKWTRIKQELTRSLEDIRSEYVSHYLNHCRNIGGREDGISKNS